MKVKYELCPVEHKPAGQEHPTCFFYNDESHFVVDCFPGYPNEYALAEQYKALPEMDVSEKFETIEINGQTYQCSWRLGEYKWNNVGTEFGKVDYDSSADTLKHIMRIQELLHLCVRNLLDRADKHDRSKLSPKEKQTFDQFTPRLATSIFGSEEYKVFLEEMKPALDNHYKENKSHHPNYHANGIDDMNLLDMVEMLIDWKASSERHETGNILESININAKRFKMSEQLVNLFKNTVYHLGFANTESRSPNVSVQQIITETNTIKDLI